MEAMLIGNPVMIFAGYPAEMEEFMKLNPGFKRRIRTTFRFPDYSCEELARMFLHLTQKRGFTTNSTLEEITDLIENSKTEGYRKEWNAGLCEKVFNLAKEHLDTRLMTDSFGLIGDKADITNFTKDDVTNAIIMLS